VAQIADRAEEVWFHSNQQVGDCLIAWLFDGGDTHEKNWLWWRSARLPRPAWLRPLRLKHGVSAPDWRLASPRAGLLLAPPALTGLITADRDTVIMVPAITGQLIMVGHMPLTADRTIGIATGAAIGDQKSPERRSGLFFLWDQNGGTRAVTCP
jgi:hypothetical protein